MYTVYTFIRQGCLCNLSDLPAPVACGIRKSNGDVEGVDEDGGAWGHLGVPNYLN